MALTFFVFLAALGVDFANVTFAPTFCRERLPRLKFGQRDLVPVVRLKAELVYEDRDPLDRVDFFFAAGFGGFSSPSPPSVPKL